MIRERKHVFVERQTYRRRRLQDAARFLPIVGMVLFMVPLLWPRGDGAGVGMSSALTYIFLCWAGLVGAAFVFSLYLRSDQTGDGSDVAAPSEVDGAE